MSPRSSTHSLAQALFGLAIILLPFNGLPYFGGVLGEMASEGAFYPLAVGLALWGVELLYGERAHFSNHVSARLLGLFVVWVFVSSVVNLPWIVTQDTKGRTGTEKLLFQIVLLVFTFLATQLVYEVASRNASPLKLFRRYALASFMVAGAYSTLEIASFRGVPFALEMLTKLNGLIHSTGNSYFGRVRSVSGEASWFAMYCSLVFPWLLSYVFTERRRMAAVHLLPLGYLLILVALSWSRTAYVITAVQLAIFIGVVSFTPDLGGGRRRLPVLLFGAAAALGIAAAVLRTSLFTSVSLASVFSSLLDRDNMSNIGRVGSQLAAYRMATDHPVFGVGLGQYGFHMGAYVPLWAKVSPEIQEWMSITSGTRWAPVHSTYARAAAESGVVGLGIWLAIWLTLLTGCWRRFRRLCQTTGRQDTLGLALIVSIVGVVLSGNNLDSFRFFGYWITLGLGWAYINGRGLGSLPLRPGPQRPELPPNVPSTRPPAPIASL